MIDGAGTPVSHTFTAVGVDGKQVAKWVDRSSGLPAGYAIVTASTRLPSKPGDPVKLQARLVVPTVVTETINGVTYNKVSRHMFAAIDISVPGDSTTVERKTLMKYVEQFCNPTNAQSLGTSAMDIDPIV